MATYLADTNLLLRLADPATPQHVIATESLARLFRQGDEVFLTAQNFIEFWAVATRPLDANGFGWTGRDQARAEFMGKALRLWRRIMFNF